MSAVVAEVLAASPVAKRVLPWKPRSVNSLNSISASLVTRSTGNGVAWTPRNVRSGQVGSARQLPAWTGRDDTTAVRTTTEIRVPGERRLGQLLEKEPKANGGSAQRTRFRKGTESPPTLEQPGVSKLVNSQAQRNRFETRGGDIYQHLGVV